MINMAICDDEKIQISIVKEMVTNICKNNNMEMVIDVFNNGKELLNIYKRNVKKYSIIFCDIIMDEMNGIELIKSIRKYDSSVQAIIITGSEEYVFDGYDVGALNYLMKPISFQKLEREILRAIKNLNLTSPALYPINNNGKTIFINLSEIFFFEVNNKTITANLENEQIDFNMKIKDLGEELKNKNFFRCHRSYLVNVSYIDSIVSSKIILKNEVEIPIGRNYRKALKEYILKKSIGV